MTSWLMVALLRSEACLMSTRRRTMGLGATIQPTLRPGDSTLEKVPQ